jgi:hypothetical protein
MTTAVHTTDRAHLPRHNTRREKGPPMTRYEDLDPEARAWVDRLALELDATAREYQQRRMEAGLPEPSGPPVIPPGTVVTATFVDVVDEGDGLGVHVDEHEVIWPEAG